VWLLDAQLGIAGAAYGAMCGAIVMSVASGHMIIRSTFTGTKVPEHSSQ